MMRRIINTSLRFRVFLTAAAVGVLFLGLTQLPKASRDVYPEFAPPFVEVQTEALGLSAQEVEQLITVPLEADLLNGVAWVKDIRSESVPGLSSITLVFEPGTSLFRARQVVQERLAQAHALPNVSKPPQMLQPVSSTSRTMMIGLSSSKLSLIEISQLARWTIKPRLMGVEGVANVSSFGQRERQLQVQVDPAQLHASGVTLQEVVETAGNALWVSPLSYLEASSPGTGGFIETPRQRLGVRHVSPIESAEDLAQVAFPPKPGADGAVTSLKLGDVAKVVEDHQPLIGDAQVDNGTGLLLVVEKLRGSNTIDVTRGVEEALASLKPALHDLRIDTSIYRPADYINRASDNVGRATLAGLALLILLLALALYHWRSALVATATVVVSLAAAAVVLDLRGTTFNTMTVAGLALALGVIIDDALAGAERVTRAAREAGGDTPMIQTVLRSFMEIRGSLTFAAVFVLLPVLPVYFMGDLFGAFGQPLATSYAIAVLVSTLVALTLTPALSVLLMAKSEQAGRQSPVIAAVARRYEDGLGRVLLAPGKVYALGGLLAVIGLVALPQIRQSELPALEERDFLMEIESAPGTSLARTNAITAGITNELRAIPGVRNVASHAGRAVTGDRVVSVNSSELWISIARSADYDETVKAVKAVAANHKDLDLDLQSYQQTRIEDARSGADGPIVVRVYGNERDLLAGKAKEVGDELRKINGLTDLNVELPVEEQSLEVEVDLERAQGFGVKPGDVRRAAAILVSGIDVGQLFYDQKVFDVVVWGAPETREGTEDVKGLLIDTPNGTQVRLDQVADVKLASSPDVIEREGVFRRIDITASVSGRDRDAVAAEVQRTIRNIDFPLEYRAELLGNFAEKQAAERRLLGLGAFAALAILLLLQAAFGSWRVGAALFVTLPVALVGGVAAALALGGDLTIGAVLGLLVVLGLAGRHGILLVRRFQQLERREGLPFGAELVRRGAAERLAPTLMSTVATALVFLPFAVLGHRPGLEILHPMAIVVLGGLVTSTLVTLFVLPALYLTAAGGATSTELDLRLFEDELAEEERAHQPPFAPVQSGSTSEPERV